MIEKIEQGEHECRGNEKKSRRQKKERRKELQGIEEPMREQPEQASPGTNFHISEAGPIQQVADTVARKTEEIMRSEKMLSENGRGMR